MHTASVSTSTASDTFPDLPTGNEENSSSSPTRTRVDTVTIQGKTHHNVGDDFLYPVKSDGTLWFQASLVSDSNDGDVVLSDAGALGLINILFSDEAKKKELEREAKRDKVRKIWRRRAKIRTEEEKEKELVRQKCGWTLTQEQWDELSDQTQFEMVMHLEVREIAGGVSAV